MATRQTTDIYPKPHRIERRRGTFAPPPGPLTMRLAAGPPKWVRAATAIAARQVGQAVRRKVTVKTDRRLAGCTAVLGGPGIELPGKLRAEPACPPGTADQAYQLTVDRDRIAIRAAGWAGLGRGLMALLDACPAGLRCMSIADGPRFGIRAMLLHIGYNHWRDKPSKDMVYGYSDRLRFSKPVFDEALALMARLRMNLVVLDLGDAIRYRSHPEIAVKGALTPAQLRALVAECRDLGVEPIPKLNFATTHDVWLKQYEKMVGTEPYHQVCDDLIAEAIGLFDGPRFFHIGMDEETLAHHRGLMLDHVVLREGKAWLDAVKRFDRTVRQHGARTWMWGDPLWPDRDGPTPAIPKRILLSDWNYARRMTFPTSAAIEQMGYDNVPAGANWTYDDNIALLTRFAADKLRASRNPGMLMTVWNPTVRSCRGNVLNAISLAAGVFWNPDGPSRAPWPRDHTGGRLRPRR